MFVVPLQVWYLINSTLCLSDAAREVCRDSPWFRQARKPHLTACGRMAKSARRCSPRPSRRQAYDETLCSDLPKYHCLLPPHVAENCTDFSLLVLTFALAVVFWMFPVFLADTSSFRSCLLLPLGLLTP